MHSSRERRRVSVKDSMLVNVAIERCLRSQSRASSSSSTGPVGYPGIKRRHESGTSNEKANEEITVVRP